MARRSRHPVLNGRTLAAAALALATLGAGPPEPLALEGPSGERVALAPREGRALLVHFWATWCPSCIEEIPALLRAADSCADALDLALVDVDEDWEDVREFAREHGITAPLLRDPDGEVWRETAGGWGLPANVIWTASGRRSEVGEKPPEAWRELFASLGCARSAAAEPAPGD